MTYPLDGAAPHRLVGLLLRGSAFVALLHRGAGTLARRGPGNELVKNDYVPLGDVEVKRGDRVHCTDGPIGRVHGLVIDPSNHHVTDFLLEEGHLWGHRMICIPIGAVHRCGRRRRPA